MQIRDTKPAGRTTAVRAVETTRRAQAPDGRAAAAPAAEPREVVSLAGIPEAELTPHVRQALLALMNEVNELRRQLEEAHGRINYLERLADEDALVPIANRRAFVRELSRTMAMAQRYGTPASVIYFDLDGLKRINDSYGHAAGDAVLAGLVRGWQLTLRPGDSLGRFGGDEFTLLLPDTTADGARALLSRLRSDLCGWSAGVATWVPGQSFEDWFAAADADMYAEKGR